MPWPLAPAVSALTAAAVSLASPKSSTFAWPRLGDENIGRLYVSMSDASCVCRIQRVGNLNAEFQNAIDQQRFAVEHVLKGLALHQLHNDERLAVVVRNFVNGADVWMIQSGGSAGFAQEAVERRLIFGGVRWEKFKGDAAIEDSVAGGIRRCPCLRRRGSPRRDSERRFDRSSIRGPAPLGSLRHLMSHNSASQRGPVRLNRLQRICDGYSYDQARRSTIREISGGTPRRTGAPTVPRPRLT